MKIKSKENLGKNIENTLKNFLEKNIEKIRSISSCRDIDGAGIDYRMNAELQQCKHFV